MEKVRRLLLMLALVGVIAGAAFGIYTFQSGKAPEDPMYAAALRLESKYPFLDVIGMLHNNDYVVMLTEATVAEDQAEDFILNLVWALQDFRYEEEKWLVIVVVKNGMGIGEVNCKADVTYSSLNDLMANCTIGPWPQPMPIREEHMMWPGR